MLRLEPSPGRSRPTSVFSSSSPKSRSPCALASLLHYCSSAVGLALRGVLRGITGTHLRHLPRWRALPDDQGKRERPGLLDGVHPRTELVRRVEATRSHRQLRKCWLYVGLEANAASDWGDLSGASRKRAVSNSLAKSPRAGCNSLTLLDRPIVWCRRGDSNPHGSPHTPLKRTCLPVPPLRHSGEPGSTG